MPMPPVMGAPPPTGVLPPEGAPPFPLGGGGVWAVEKFMVNSVMVISVAIVFVIFFMIL